MADRCHQYVPEYDEQEPPPHPQKSKMKKVRLELAPPPPPSMASEDEEQELPPHPKKSTMKKVRQELAPPPPSPPYYGRTSSPRRTFCTIFTILLLLAGATVLIVWLVYHPQKPQFSVAAGAIYDLNATSPPFITTSMQFTLVARNPNKRVSIMYDKLTAYVSYRDQIITPPVSLQPFYHETKSSVELSPVMGGGEGVQVPASAEVVNGLMVDEAYGLVGLRVVVLGRLRWKAGAIRTGRYGLYVKCDVWVGFKKGFVGQVPLLGSPSNSHCKVDV